jgi:NitT/TauT family transport system substrate-binding protein
MPVMFRRVAALAALLLIGGVHAGLAQDKVSILLDYPQPEGIHAGIELALQKGWFREAGLEAEVRDGKGSNLTIQQVAAGQADIGLAQLSAMAVAASNGVPVIAVMGIAQRGDLSLSVAEDTGVKTLKDVKGLKIGATPGSAAVALWDAFLAASGTRKGDIDIVYLDGSAQVSAYLAKSVAGLLVTVSYFTPLVEKIRPAKAFQFSDYGLSVPSYGMVVSRESLDKKPAVIGKVVQVLQRSWKYVVDGHEQEGVDAIIARRANLRPDPTVLMGMLKLNIAQMGTPATKDRSFGWQSEEDWKQAVEVMTKASLLKSGVKLSDLYTNRFIPAQ